MSAVDEPTRPPARPPKRPDEFCAKWMRYERAYCNCRKGHGGDCEFLILADPSTATPEPTECGKWMKRAKAPCGRKPRHAGDCRKAKSLADNRPRLTGRRVGQADEATVRLLAKEYRLARYGLTPERFAQLLEVQDYACGMCREPFTEQRVACIDHDHACCPAKKQSCGKCVRGLLCRDCNTALGHIEARFQLALAYTLNAPAKLLPAA